MPDKGNHSLSVGDVDDDGCDEVVYGGCCIDHNGKGLWNSGMDMEMPCIWVSLTRQRKGLQIWSCFEACPFKVGAALRDARTGEQSGIFRIVEIWDVAW